jgi:hypothetical protein
MPRSPHALHKLELEKSVESVAFCDLFLTQLGIQNYQIGGDQLVAVG